MKEGLRANAIAVDLDPACLNRAPANSAIEFVIGDSTSPDSGLQGCDVVFVGNFSIGYLHSRRDLLAYLTLSRQRLEKGNSGFGGGVFVCDTYGGASAFKLGSLTRKHPSRTGEIIHYHWAHEEADPLTSMVTNSISFKVERNGEIVQESPRAFVYRWRLWSIAELREALTEAGFVSTKVYIDCNIAPGQSPMAVESAAELKDDWIVLVAARVE